MSTSVRPIYETQEHLDKEEVIKKYLEVKWDATLIKLLWKYGADYLATKNDLPVAYVEIKGRNNVMKMYPKYILSLHKAVNCLTFAAWMRIPFYLIVQWNDARAYVRIKQRHLREVKLMDAKYRDDPKDKEPCIQIDINEFKIF